LFKKLRNRFLILNLVTISVMMLIAFSTIYFINYTSVHKNIDMELKKTLEFSTKPSDQKKEPRPDFMDPSSKSNDHLDFNQQKRSLSFAITVDTQGNIIDSFTSFDMEATFLENAKNTVLSKNIDKGTVSLGDNDWAYLKIPQGNKYKIVFLDITFQLMNLRQLIYIFLTVSSIMLVFIFFVSKFFANRSIIPIKEAFDKQKQFIGDASHELKTPLAVINTNVDVLLSNKEDTILDQSKWLYYIKSETERMNKLTNDLLYLAQVDYSEAKMIFSELNLSEAVENIILTMEAVIFEKDLSFEYYIEPSLKILGNAEQIKQVVMILLDNAIKYTNPKGTINLSLTKYSSNILLVVKNSGEGISAEHIDKVFDRFYRTDKSRVRKSGGYGLGLAIAKAIVEQHKGRIYVKSTLNESTTFTVELPNIIS
jgi:two-component system sensor histidine kinase CiaH